VSEPNTPTPTPTPYGATWPGPTAPQPWAVPPPLPSRKPRTGLAVLLVLVTAVGALCTFGATYALTGPGAASGLSSPSPVAQSPSQRGGASARATATPSAKAGATPSVGPSLPSDKEPELRPGAAPKVFAEKFDGKKYVMKFKGWPFAFETHGDWGCLKGTIAELPDAHGWGCVNEKTRSGQKINIMLRRCVPTCTASVMTEMNKVWLTDAASARKRGDRTFYSETLKDAEGRYAVDLSHFMAEKPGGPLQWQVGVYTYSPPNISDDVKMTLNSILYQAG
jgi:hypothetical protein